MTERSGRRHRSRCAALLAAGLAVGSLVSGCNIGLLEYGYGVSNYSSNRYVVRLTFQDGTASVIGVPPRGIVGEHSVSKPLQAVLYDQGCAAQLATLEIPGSWAYLRIDAHGALSLPTSPKGSGDGPTDEAPSYASPEPVPSSCPAG